MKRLLILIISMFALGCIAYLFIPKENKRVVQFIVSKPRVLLLQPLGNFNTELSRENFSRLKKNFSSTRILATIPLPASAYYKPRDRYRADSLLNISRYRYGADTLLLLMTHRDISVTKKLIKDWGIMGLAHSPGNVCVVSTYRLNNAKLSEQLYKVSIHELGHTQGLAHCADTTCYMRDASGGNPLDAEKDFCPKCKKVMQMKGWKV